MTDKKENTFSGEVASRLSDFFSENDLPTPPDNQESPSDKPEFPLRNLKAILLSIEWEITDDVLSSLMDEISRSKEVYWSDKILLSFLKLLGSVGKYVSAKKVTAHPDSINLLHSIYGSLEKIAEIPAMGEEEKRRILSAEVEKFKTLKEKILLTKRNDLAKPQAQRPASEEVAAPALDTAAAAEQPSIPAFAKPDPPPGTAAMQKPEPEDLAFFVEEIRKTIKAEFDALREELREELRSWKKNG